MYVDFQLDQPTALYCLEQLQQGMIGQDGLNYGLLILTEELKEHGISEVDALVIDQFRQLPADIHQQANQLIADLNQQPVFVRLAAIAEGRLAFYVLNRAAGEGLDLVAWSALDFIEDLLSQFNHSDNPDRFISLADLGADQLSLELYQDMDPHFRLVVGGQQYKFWQEYLDHQANLTIIQYNSFLIN